MIVLYLLNRKVILTEQIDVTNTQRLPHSHCDMIAIKRESDLDRVDGVVARVDSEYDICGETAT